MTSRLPHPEEATGQPLVLSLFPGIGLLDMAFEQEGFCVVRGPDLLWGGDVRNFHPPRDRFDGVIGGPPCKAFSPMANISRARGFNISPDMIPEYVRVVDEAGPAWWISENVTQSPLVQVPGYITRDTVLNALDLGSPQNRKRRICFGTVDGRKLPVPTLALRPQASFCTVTAQGKKRHDATTGKLANGNATLHEMLEAQGLPATFFADIEEALKLHGTDVLTKRGKMLVVGNGVPLPMGRAIAKAVRLAMYPHTIEAAS